jgi:MFS family permease
MPADSRPRARVGSTAYRLYVVAQVASLLGTTMGMAALFWLMLHVGHGNALDLAAIEVVQSAPLLFLSRRAGLLVTRFGSAATLAATQSALALVTLAIAIPLLIGWISSWYLLVAACAIGCVQSADLPARQLFMLDLLGPAELRRGSSLYAAILGLSRIGGPAIAGGVIAIAGEAPVFLVDAASFAAVVAVVIAARGEAVHAGDGRARGRPGTAAERPAARRFRWVLDLPRDIQVAAGMALLLGGFAYQFAVTNPLMAGRVFHLGAAGYGLLGAFLAAGGIGANYWSSRRGDPSLTEMLTWAGLFGVVEAVAAALPSAWAYDVALVAIGGLLALFTSTCLVYIQQHAPAAQRGQAVSAYNAAFIGFAPAGAVLVAGIADTAGVRWSLAVPGLALLACVGALLVSRRALRRARTSPA